MKAPNYAALVRIVRDNPHAFLSCEELACFLRVTRDAISRAASAPDSPFIGKSCIPAWAVEWFKAHGGIKAK